MDDHQIRQHAENATNKGILFLISLISALVIVSLIREAWDYFSDYDLRLVITLCIALLISAALIKQSLGYETRELKINFDTWLFNLIYVGFSFGLSLFFWKNISLEKIQYGFLILPLLLPVFVYVYKRYLSVEGLIEVEPILPVIIPVDKKSIFISDSEVGKDDDDYLNASNQVEHFSRMVLNNYSNERLVVGLEGEWGSGKTSFLQFCINKWESDENVEVMPIFSAFSCHADNFLESYIDQLNSFLNSLFPDKDFRNELDFIFKESELKWKLPIPLLDFELTLPIKVNDKDSVNALKERIKNLNKRLVIVIDDLDRVGVEQIKEIARIVRYSNVFESTTFVLCYDLTNLVSIDSELKSYEGAKLFEAFDSTNSKSELSEESYLEEDYINKNIARFLEKIINVKYVLVNDSSSLSNFIDSLLTEYDK